MSAIRAASCRRRSMDADAVGNPDHDTQIDPALLTPTP
jgi:hypothetical protein